MIPAYQVQKQQLSFLSLLWQTLNIHLPMASSPVWIFQLTQLVGFVWFQRWSGLSRASHGGRRGLHAHRRTLLLLWLFEIYNRNIVCLEIVSKRTLCFSNMIIFLSPINSIRLHLSNNLSNYISIIYYLSNY